MTPFVVETFGWIGKGFDRLIEGIPSVAHTLKKYKNIS